MPPDPSAEELLDEEGEALRHELEERLREYARVKVAGAWLAEREAEQALRWGRPGSTLPPIEDIPLEDLSVHLLERTVRRLIEEQRRRRPREVEANPPSVLERMTEILSVLRDAWSLLFSSLLGQERQRSEIVVSLLGCPRVGPARSCPRAANGAVRRDRHRTPDGEDRPMPEPIDIVEGLLFASDVPLEAERIREVLDLASVADAHALMAALKERYERDEHALE